MGTIYVDDGAEWSSWSEVTAGDGVASISGEVYTVSSGDGSGASYLRKRIRAFPGDLYLVSVSALLVSGSGADAPGLAVDYPSTGTIIDELGFDSGHWKEYQILVMVPADASSSDYITISAGSFTGRGGECKIARPAVRKIGGFGDGTILFTDSAGTAVLYPSGLMECWGVVTVSGGSGAATSSSVTFPLPFASTITASDMTCQTTANTAFPGDPGVAETSFSNLTPTGVSIYTERSNGDPTEVHWFVKGVWREIEQTVS